MHRLILAASAHPLGVMLGAVFLALLIYMAPSIWLACKLDRGARERRNGGIE